MTEYIHGGGEAVKKTDALLDEILRLGHENAVLREEIASLNLLVDWSALGVAEPTA